MKIAIIVIPAFLVITLFVTSCRDSGSSKRDILMETIENLEDLFDTPKTRGYKIYSQYCTVCHGSEGKGDGFNSYNINPKPKDFTDSSFVARLDTTMIMETISKGGSAVSLSPLMPSWGHTLTESDIKDVSNYIIYLATHPEEE